MNLILPLRIAQAVFALIVLGLSAYCVDIFPGWSEAAFLVFTSVWSMVVLAYLLLTPMYFPAMHNRWIVVGLESVTMIFWFAGFIAIAASVDNYICLWYACRVTGCAKAAAAFGAFSWACWVATLALIVHALLQFRKGEQAADADAGRTDPKVAEGDDIEMRGGGQRPQQPKELNGTNESNGTNGANEANEANGETGIEDTNQKPNDQPMYGHPPPADGNGVERIPDPADFGGVKETA